MVNRTVGFQVLKGFLTAALGFFCLAAGAGAQESEPEELSAMRVQFRKSLKEAMLPVKRGYGRALRDKMTELTQAGKLDEAIAFKAEMEAVAAELMAGAGAPVPAGPVKRGTVIDLLKLAAPEKHGRPVKKWAKVGDTLECVEGNFRPKMILPYQPPEDYDFTITFSQPRMRNGVGLIMPNGEGGLFDVIAAERAGTSAGLSVGGSYAPEFSAREEGMFAPGKAYTLTVEVRKDGVAGFVDGEEIFRYEGDRSALTSSHWQKHEWPDRVAISADDPAVITRLEVREITGQGRVLR